MRARNGAKSVPCSVVKAMAWAAKSAPQRGNWQIIWRWRSPPVVRMQCCTQTGRSALEVSARRCIAGLRCCCATAASRGRQDTVNAACHVNLEREWLEREDSEKEWLLHSGGGMGS